MRPSTRLVVLGRKQLWTPAALGLSLALWLDADDSSTITLNGSTVSQWRDKSGNGRHASQATVAKQPAYSATGFNNKPRILFDGIDDTLAIASTALFSSGNADLSIFLVYNPPSVNPSKVGIVVGAFFTNFQEGNLELLFSRTIAYAMPWGLYLNASLDLANEDYVQNKKSIIEFIRQSGVITGYTDGLAENSVNNSQSVYSGANTKSAWALGALLGNNGEYGNFELPEIICVNSSLSTTDRQRLEGYLAHKWELTPNLPSNHPFKFTPPMA